MHLVGLGVEGDGFRAGVEGSGGQRDQQQHDRARATEVLSGEEANALCFRLSHDDLVAIARIGRRC